MAGTVITQQPASSQDTSSSSALKHDPGVVRDYQPADPGQDDTEAGHPDQGREIGIRNGVRYAYTGNVHDVEGGSTCCHACGELLIGRDWYRLGRLEPDRGRTLPALRYPLRVAVRRATGALGPSPASGDPATTRPSALGPWGIVLEPSCLLLAA